MKLFAIVPATEFKSYVYIFGVRIFVFFKIPNFIKILSYKLYRKKRKAHTVCYTYQSVGYDNLIQHKYICSDWDYICFTDNPKLLKHEYIGIWKIEKTRYSDFDSKRNSGWHKTHPHELFPDYENSIWIDGNIDVRSSYLCELVFNTKSVLLTTSHNIRDCIYDEIDAVCQNSRDTFESCELIKNFLKLEKMPKHYGLNETGVMYREHGDELVKKIDNMWWDMIKNYSKRDQLSFSYVLWKNNIKVSDISIPTLRKNFRNFLIYSHKKCHR